MHFFMVLMEENTKKKLHNSNNNNKTKGVSSLKPVIYKNIPKMIIPRMKFVKCFKIIALHFLKKIYTKKKT